MYYSAKLNGFIPAEWKDDGTYSEDTWPQDAVPLDDNELSEYKLSTAPQGKMLGAKSGRPAWVDIPPLSDSELGEANAGTLLSLNQLAAAQKSALANRIGVINDAIELEEVTPDEIAELPIRQSQLTEWKRYAIYLGRVNQQDGWAINVTWPDQPARGMGLSSSTKQ